MKKACISILLVYIFVAANSQISSITPAKPTWNDTLLIRYNPLDTAAALKGTEQVYARIVTYMQDGTFEKYNVALQNNNGALQQHFVMPVHAASLRIQFYTLNRDDDSATTQLLVYTNGRTIPVEGAYMSAFFVENPEVPFEAETQHYPYNYLAYAKYFNVASMIEKHDKAEEIINSLLKKTDSVYHTKNVSAGLLAALCVGYAKTANLTTAKKYLFKLFTMFPARGEAAFAFSIYNYEYYKANGKNIEEDVKNRVKEIFVTHPQSALAADDNVFYYLENDTSVTIKNFEDAFLPRYRTGQTEYYALGTLARIYIGRNIKADSARAMLLSSIAIFNSGAITHQYRLTPSRYKSYVGGMLVNVVKADILLADYDNAVLHASAAISVISGSNVEGNFMNDILHLRATAYRKLNNLNLAMEDYKTLYKNGDKGILDSMGAIFPFGTQPYRDFASFTASLTSASTPAKKTAITSATDFTGVDLKGDTLRLSAFKGKIVVLNYWGTGCGPCVAEMPRLNELVAQNKNRQDVVFLAATLDERDRLLSFFKTKKFDYRVFTATDSFTSDYSIDALPVHIVIGKNGELLSRSVGSRPDIAAYLQGIINSSF